MPHDTEDAALVELTDAERRVVERLGRARLVAAAAAPDLTPTLEDLIELDELIHDEEWDAAGEE